MKPIKFMGGGIWREETAEETLLRRLKEEDLQDGGVEVAELYKKLNENQ